MTSSLICDILQASLLTGLSQQIMHRIYLSPHLDDVALSCGGLVWEQAHAGEQVSIWTICAGDPPMGSLSSFAQSLHQRWETGPRAVTMRRVEDVMSCEIMNASHYHFPILDCIYRTDSSGTYLYPSEEAIRGEIHPSENALIESLCDSIIRKLPKDAILVSPMAIGGHVDHRLTRAAAENVGCPLQFYVDFPYVVKENVQLDSHYIDSGKPHLFTISQAGLEAWVRAVAAHRSQISTFWTDLDAMRVAIEEYSQRIGGVLLWTASSK